MNFDMPKDQSSIIKVIGVGGGGSNAVNHMYESGIKGVDFIVCNTDAQALDISPVPVKVQLGASLTEGRGAGSIPEVGKNAAIENIDDIKEILEKNTTMVFVTAGMGGGTGTGAAPIIAQAAKDMGILTVGIVTIPFLFEGRKRKIQAEEGLRAMREAVDTLLVIKNDKLREIHGNLSLKDAFAQADNILSTAAKGIAELISVTGAINVDMNDVNTVMRDSGVAIMGQATAEGENRAIKAAKQALESPLLNDNDIVGAQYILLNITYGEDEVMMDEITDITDFIQDAAGSTADVIWGHGMDETLGKKISVTVIATGFKSAPDTGVSMPQNKTYMALDDERVIKNPKELDKPVTSPTFAAAKQEEMEDEPFLKNSSENTEEESKTDKPGTEEEIYVKSQLASRVEEPSQKEQEQNQKIEYFTLNDEVEEEEIAPANMSRTVSPSPEPVENNKRFDQLSQEELLAINRQRMSKIAEITNRIKNPSAISELEKEPAYKRRNISLDKVPHSSDSQVSRYSLNEETDEDGEKRVEIRPNNSYLHDNVD